MLTREEFIQHVEFLREDIRGVHDRLDTLNGRTRTAEQDIAVLKDRDAPGSRKATASWGALGGILSGVGWFLWEKFSK